MVIAEELDDLIKNGYTCSHCGDDTTGLFYAHQEYKKWKAAGKP
jgi:hypothetical protein